MSATLIVQIHAELVYAESLLLRAIISFIQDENLVSFIKGALKIKACYNSYKLALCRQLLHFGEGEYCVLTNLLQLP